MQSQKLLSSYVWKGQKVVRLVFLVHCNLRFLEACIGLLINLCFFFLMCLLQRENIWGPFLIISPASTLNNWHQEFARFVPKFKVISMCKKVLCYLKSKLPLCLFVCFSTSGNLKLCIGADSEFFHHLVFLEH